ncbi:Os05g0298700 [Oryza sativa Japonica Group]|uniref:Os05g0298700 protein n=1 Tax=Oryza sativa subsp. japonica TaxID=39947 RepID=A0A0P0WKA9_ORYSJ|nr:hypothetical protein EE612_028420 [Oryza sativa]BAS93212.1 Os05g0298700 [Oryza sativa Japonica Group]
MALAHEVAFEVNLIEDDGGLAGWAPVGTRTALSSHAERDTAMLISGAVSAAEPNERIRRSSGRYIVASRRADEEDGLRRAVPAGALVPRVTYRVVGWVSVQGQGDGRHHAVRVGLRVDGDGGDDERGSSSTTTTSCVGTTPTRRRRSTSSWWTRCGAAARRWAGSGCRGTWTARWPGRSSAPRWTSSPRRAARPSGSPSWT